MLCPKCSRSLPDDAALCCDCGRVLVRRKAAARRGNGQGTAYRRGSTWTVRGTVGIIPRGLNKRPKQVYRTKGGFPTKAAALAAAPDLLRGTIKQAAPPLAHYWDLYAAGELLKLSVSKRTAYKIAWKRLAPLAPRRVDQLTVEDLRATVGKSASTYYPARDCRQLLVHLFTLAAADGWVQKDLPTFILLPDREEKAREPFTDAEQAALWRCWESGCLDAALPLVMIYTGMMPGEMMRLRPEMVDLEGRKITGAGLKTKVRRESPIYLPTAIIPVMETAMQHLTPGGFILYHSEAPFYAHYYAALEAAGVRRLEPYSCRHTTATALAIDRQTAPQTIKKIMRWSSTRMLDRYAHPDDSDALAAFEAKETGA